MDKIQDIFDGFHAHFDSCVAFPQQFDSILFNHEIQLL
jgi:hypothetical protein